MIITALNYLFGMPDLFGVVVVVVVRGLVKGHKLGSRRHRMTIVLVVRRFIPLSELLPE